MKFLVIQQKMIGDVLTSTILCENLKQLFPGCVVDFIANDNTLAVTEGHPHIDNIIVFKKEYKRKKFFFKFLKTLKKTKYDVLIDVYGKTESNLISLFTPAGIKISYYKWYTHFIYTHTLKRYTKPDPDMGLAVKNRLLLLKPIIKDRIPPHSKPGIYLKEAETEHAKSFLEQHGIDTAKPLFMLSVLGSGISKTYPLPYMAKVIDEIAETTQATLLFNYIPEQWEQAKTLYNLCSNTARSRIKFEVFAASLRGFLGLLYHCNALIGNEGGAVNMAKALGVPTFSIFSPWIRKEAWGLFENAANITVHLKDFKPGLFEGKPQKQLKKDAIKLYEHFKPSYFREELQEFLTSALK